jgi:hypothetical protein
MAILFISTLGTRDPSGILRPGSILAFYPIVTLGPAGVSN